MDVNEIYELMKFIINKNMQGFLQPSKFNLSINQGQRSYQAFLLGSFKDYTPGRPISRVELGQNSVVRQRLAPTIYGYNLSIYGTGFSPYPGDYLQTDAMWGIYGHNRIRYVEQSALDSFYNSVIDPIATNPIYLLEDNGFRFYPENQWMAKLSYVKDAPEIVWGYTTDVNGRAVYNSATSVDPVWDTVAIFEIIVRALQIVGVNLQAPQVIAYSQEIKNTGQ